MKNGKCSSREFFEPAVYLVPVPKRPKESTAGRLRVGVRRTFKQQGKEHEELGNVAGLWNGCVRNWLW